MLALLFLHAAHDSDHATNVGNFCMGLTVMFGMIIVIRLRWRVTVSAAPLLLGRAPPVRYGLKYLVPFAGTSSPPPLRV